MTYISKILYYLIMFKICLECIKTKYYNCLHYE